MHILFLLEIEMKHDSEMFFKNTPVTQNKYL